MHAHRFSWDGLRRGGSVLLEPMMRLHITAPEGYLGRLLSEVAAMGGEMEDSQLRQGMCDVTARAPLTGCMDFSQRLAALDQRRRRGEHGAGGLSGVPLR